MKYTTSSFLALALLVVSWQVFAQTVQLERRLPTVTQGNTSSVNGFASGFNSPQFSTVDFNRDGQQDLFVFDRVGDTPMAFRRNSSGDWQMDQELLAGFPELEAWVLLRDFNNDGAVDIFTFNRTPAFGVLVYTGRYDSSNRLQFDRFIDNDSAPMLVASVPGQAPVNVYVSNIDYPDINDVDCDGDLDIVTFDISGGFIDLYHNRSVELGYGQDSLIFELRENCFGGVFESGISEFLILAPTPEECASGFAPGDGLEFRHVGSSLLTLDEDGDGDKDLVLGDLSFGNLNMSTNGGDCEEAWMNEQDPFFPSYNASVDLPLFPAAYYLDIDGDGIRDFVSAPNAGENGKDFENVWYYRNTATDNNPTFDLQQTDFLVGGMIDLGTRGKPALLDYNADGLMDLVVGNFSFFEFSGLKNSRLYLYENTGTSTSPAFTLVDDDFLGMTAFSIDLPPGSNGWNFAPTFGDLDNDGDQDALVGDVRGRLIYLENTAGEGEPVSYGPAFYAYMDIDIGASATPQIIDLNRDGLMDLVVGEKGGAIRYFPNTGTSEAAFFGADEEAAPNIAFLGGVDGRIPNESTGYSAPFFVDFGDRYELFMATEHGTLEWYGDIDGNLDGTFAILNENLISHPEGDYLHPVLWDWDNDGFLDIVIGNSRGGVSYFASNIQIDGTVGTANLATAAQLDIYPNPATELITIQLGEEWGSGMEWKLYNSNGQLLQHSVARLGSQQIDCSQWPAGVYFLQVTSSTGQRTEKLILQ